MVSQLLYWKSESESHPEGWIYRSRKQWQEATGLTRYEQETARTKLRNTSFWEEIERGLPCRLHYRINLSELAKSVALNPVGGKPPNK